MRRNTLVISDLHAPFQHKHSLDFLKQTYDKYKCGRVVCIGDEVDFHRTSRHDAEVDSLGVKDEFDRALVFLGKLYRLFPKAQVCTSNHTARPFRMASKVGVLPEFLRSYRDMLHAPSGWNWADHFVHDGVLYFHGEPYSGKDAALNACKDKLTSVVMGHVHSYGGIQYYATEAKTIFGLNVGCLIDTDAYAFRYGKAYRGKPTIGCGVVLNGGKEAHFVPLV